MKMLEKQLVRGDFFVKVVMMHKRGGFRWRERETSSVAPKLS